MYLESIINLFYSWQALIGSFIGAAAPLVIWFFIQRHENIKKRKDNLYYLERLLVFNINLVGDTYRTVNKFINENLQFLMDNVQSHIIDKKYSLDGTFFPLFLSKFVDKNMLRLNTGSSYLDNKLNQVQHMSENFSAGINDLRYQFRELVNNNRVMVVEKMNDPDVQSYIYKKNLEEFVAATRRDLLEINIISYLKFLIKVRAAAIFYKKIGNLKWQMKFSPRYRFFLSRKKYEESLDSIHDNIDKYFDEEAEKEFQLILTQLEKPEIKRK